MCSVNCCVDICDEQIIKLFAKIFGQTVFGGGMHMCTNEFQEIRSTLLTLTKAHDQFMPSLENVSKSLETYGHQPVQLVFTDNVRGDKAELERVISSLRKDVVPVPESSLEKLVVPVDWNVSILLSAYQVNTRINSILDVLGDGEDLFVAVGMEFPVDRTHGIQGKVSLISIGLDHEIFLLPVGH